METDVRVSSDEEEATAVKSGARGVPKSNLGALAVMALTFVPWILVVLLTGGIAAAINILGYAITVALIGYAVVFVALPANVRAAAIFLAPATGVLIASALTAFWVRPGFPVFYVAPVWLVLVAIGAFCLLRDRKVWTRASIAYGRSLVVLSLLICAVFFVPGARRDAVLRSDGSFNWMYVDTQYNYAIAAAIKDSDGPPKEPGSATVPLYYHFGGYAPAAVISRFDGLKMGDSFARVTRGASLWALVLSCFGLGTLLSLKATGEKFGGIMSVAGFFFYGALLALFTDELNSSSYVTGAILFKIPAIGVGHDGGPFSHLVLGHSELHAFIAITAIIGLCLAHRESAEALGWLRALFLVLPALAVPMHSVASLYCLGVAIILLFWGCLNSLHSWMQILLMFCLYFLTWKLMGFGHAPDAVSTRIALQITQQWSLLAIWFLVGLGFRITGFSWISKPLKDPLSILVFATVLGFLSFFLLVHFRNGEEVYGLFFLQSVFSIFAFSRLPYGFWRPGERSRLILEWLRFGTIGAIVLGAYGIVVGARAYAVTHIAGIEYYRIKILAILFCIALFVATPRLMKRSSFFSKTLSAVFLCILSVGFLAWIAPWTNFGLGRMKMDVTLSPGEVQGLTSFKQIVPPDDRFATNKHSVDVASNTERSFGYASLAERPVLVEGFLYHQLRTVPGFNSLLSDNDLMFTTSDPETLHQLSQRWHVRWILARPGTDIALPKPLPSWIVEEPNGGALKIYRVN